MDKRAKRANKLIRDISKGKLKALDKFYDEFGSLCFYVAKKYLFDKSYAEDLLSDFFVQLVRTSKQLDDCQNGLNWCFKCIKNMCINKNKRESKFIFESLDDEKNRLADKLFIPDDMWLSGDIGEAFLVLSERERFAVEKKYFEGYTIREIALMLETSPASALRLIKSGLEKMKSELKK